MVTSPTQALLAHLQHLPTTTAYVHAAAHAAAHAAVYAAVYAAAYAHAAVYAVCVRCHIRS